MYSTWPHWRHSQASESPLRKRSPLHLRQPFNFIHFICGANHPSLEFATVIATTAVPVHTAKPTMANHSSNDTLYLLPSYCRSYHFAPWGINICIPYNARGKQVSGQSFEKLQMNVRRERLAIARSPHLPQRGFIPGNLQQMVFDAEAKASSCALVGRFLLLSGSTIDCFP
jgi:hypothetical protein